MPEKKHFLKNRWIRATMAFTAGLLIAFFLWDWRSQPLRNPDVMAISQATPQPMPSGEREGMFYQKFKDGTVQCQICFRNCRIAPGTRGFCKNKENRDGILYNVIYAKPSALHIDPIEKEPQLHMLPGTQILCIGTAGCNFACRHCQNWHLSQRAVEEMRHHVLPPEEVIRIALEKNIPTISFTYNDPISMYEYLYDTARLAKKNGLYVLWHSNGSMNPEPLKELLKYTDAVTIDLKGFREDIYQQLSDAKLAPVLEALKIIKAQGVWLEIVNLIIPTVNDDPDDIRRMCVWIKENLGEDVPLHFSRFSPAYRLTDLPPTPIATLENAFQIAKETGLHYVTIGNVPGHIGNSTFCPKCHKRLIQRVHFNVLSNDIVDGKCNFCGHAIPGIWNPDVDATRGQVSSQEIR